MQCPALTGCLRVSNAGGIFRPPMGPRAKVYLGKRKHLGKDVAARSWAVRNKHKKQRFAKCVEGSCHLQRQFGVLFGAPEPDSLGSHAYGCVTHGAFVSPSAILGSPRTRLSELSGALHWARPKVPHFWGNGKNYIFTSVHTQYTEYTHTHSHTHTHPHPYAHTCIHSYIHIHM